MLQRRKQSPNVEGDTLSLVTSIKLHFLIFGDIVHVCVFSRPDLIDVSNKELDGAAQLRAFM